MILLVLATWKFHDCVILKYVTITLYMYFQMQNAY